MTLEDHPSLGALADSMGIRVTEATAERVVATMPVAGNTQPFGLLHGGANAVLAETAGSVAAALMAGPGMSIVGLEISCSHHRAATEGLVTAVAVPLTQGRTIATHDIRITDAQGRPVCTARLTCLLRPLPQA